MKKRTDDYGRVWTSVIDVAKRYGVGIYTIIAAIMQGHVSFQVDGEHLLVPDDEVRDTFGDVPDQD